MLVLTRREDEAIVIDGRIKVTVVEIRGSQIRLGIEAPKEIPIQREEIIGDPTAAIAASCALGRASGVIRPDGTSDNPQPSH
jgi:carbon storage regulator CsrA